MSLFRLLLLAAIAILIGACGSNDEDIETEVDETAASPEHVMPGDAAGPDPVLEQETAPSRDAGEDVIPTPETGTELDPEETETTTPDTTADTEPQSTPEDGMPQQEDVPQ